MSNLLEKVYDSVGDTTRDATFVNDDLIPSIDTLDFSITYRAGDDVVAVTTATGAPIPTLDAADELVHDMLDYFVKLTASRLVSEYEGDTDRARTEADEALQILRGDILGLDGENA